MTDKTEKRALPHILLEAVKERRAVLIFGAGASKECKDSAGETPPNGEQMRDKLSEKFFGHVNKQRDLQTVSEMAIKNGYGEPLVFDEVAKMITGFKTSAAHFSLTKFNWRGLATTNYDTFVEEAYSKTDDPKQTCVRFVKDAEPYDTRLDANMNSVPYFKLHGCLDHRLDSEVPLVLSSRHYNRVKENRQKLFDRLSDWAQTSVLIFVGYRLADPHIRSLIYDIDPGKRPQWYIVTPTIDDDEVRFWASESVDLLGMTFGKFMETLEEAVPPIARALGQRFADNAPPYLKHCKTGTAGSEKLQQYLSSELRYMHSGLSFNEVPAEKFYSGFDVGWCGIVRKLDFARDAAERMLYSALDVPPDDVALRFYLLQGSAGSGKTIALKRAAYDAATAIGELVLWVEPNAVIRPELIKELYGLTGQRIYIFIDQISLAADNASEFLKEMALSKIPLTLISAEREADWNNYCSALEAAYPPEIFKLSRLSKKEAEALVNLLVRHGCLGALSSLSAEDRVLAFTHEDRADGQLLVALHELTKAKTFEEIIEEEFERIVPVEARRFYLDIATMHQFGVIARAGAISRIGGVRFADFEDKFFDPLSNIVHVVPDSYTGEQGYTARHAHVSEIVFGVACPSEEEKSDQLMRIFVGLDDGYSSDQRIITGICKGRTIAQKFPSVERGREIFQRACSQFPNTAFLFQQAAIFEYSHQDGSLSIAEERAESARRIDPKNHIYLHTLAEVMRRQALETTNRPHKEQLRSRSRTYLNSISLNDSRKDSTFCKLLIDEAIDEMHSLPDSPLDHQIIEFDSKIEDAVARLNKAKADFPEETEFHSSEATLWQKLGEGEKALKSLERAAAIKPKHAAVFSRLAAVKKRVTPGADILSVLAKGLEKFSDDKGLHQQIALEKLESDETIPADVEHHLRSSYAAGDHNFDARMLFAEYCFLTGKIPECISVFDEIDRRAPRTFRKVAGKYDNAIERRIERQVGRVENRKERFFFVQSPCFPSRLFSHSTSLLEKEYDTLREGQEVSFKIRFNRKGPVAVDVQAI